MNHWWVLGLPEINCCGILNTHQGIPINSNQFCKTKQRMKSRTNAYISRILHPRDTHRTRLHGVQLWIRFRLHVHHVNDVAYEWLYHQVCHLYKSSCWSFFSSPYWHRHKLDDLRDKLHTHTHTQASRHKHQYLFIYFKVFLCL